MKTTNSTSGPESHPPPENAELSATAAKLKVNETERPALTDAATAPSAVPGQAAKRTNAWHEAIRCWVLSRS